MKSFLRHSNAASGHIVESALEICSNYVVMPSYILRILAYYTY